MQLGSGNENFYGKICKNLKMEKCKKCHVEIWVKIIYITLCHIKVPSALNFLLRLKAIPKTEIFWQGTKKFTIFPLILRYNVSYTAFLGTKKGLKLTISSK